jgi:hypothetical protein
MSGLRAGMSDRYQICPVNQDNVLRKNRSGAKAMNLRPDKLTTSKQGTIEHIKIREITRGNLFTRNHT